MGTVRGADRFLDAQLYDRPTTPWVVSQIVTLRHEIEQSQLDFIRTDLVVCLTLAAVSATAYNMGDREHAERTLESAEKGYSDMLRFYSQANRLTPEVEKELKSKFQHLRERLDGLRRLGEG
jgi:hypothetical protein